MTYTTTGPCVIADGHVRATGAGACRLTASQAGDADWAPAAPVTRKLAIERARQAIAFEPPDRSVFGAPARTLSASATSGLPVSVEAEGPCVIGPAGDLEVTASGTCTLTATQPGDHDWAPAAPVTRQLVIEPADQSIAFEPLHETVFGAEPIELDASATSGLPVTFSTEGPCEVGDGRLLATGAGICAVTASQPGDGQFGAARMSGRSSASAGPTRRSPSRPSRLSAWASRPSSCRPSRRRGWP